MTCLKNGKSNPWICLKMGAEPMNMFERLNRTYTNVRIWESNPLTCLNVNRIYASVRKWDSNPELLVKFERWFKLLEYLLLSGVEPGMCIAILVLNMLLSKIFFFFYTLVMVFVHYGAVIIAFYEAVHCLFGHHKIFAEFHCTGVWEVYSWTIYQRLVWGLRIYGTLGLHDV